MDCDGDAKTSGTESEKQPLVLLDVGGQSFKLARSTLERHPDCLLAKMVAEFPSIVNQGKELYIDRDPFAFPWILQIHRDGDYKNCIPEMSMESLQLELDFYQLPSLEELGLNVSYYSFASGEKAARDLVSHILHEIDACGLKDMYPWHIVVYYKIAEGKVDGGRRILVLPPEGAGKLEYIISRGHDDFFTALTDLPAYCARTLHNGWLRARPRDKDVIYHVMLATDWLIRFMKTELEKFGLKATACLFRSTNGAGNFITYNLLRFQYEHK